LELDSKSADLLAQSLVGGPVGGLVVSSAISDDLAITAGVELGGLLTNDAAVDEALNGGRHCGLWFCFLGQYISDRVFAYIRN
jgi:hypothetical protein